MTTRDLRVRFEADGADDVERRISKVDSAFAKMAKSASAGAQALDRQANESDDLRREQERVGRSARELTSALDAQEREAEQAAAAQRRLASASADASLQLDRVEGAADRTRTALGSVSSGLVGLAAAFGVSKLVEIGEEGGALQVIRRNLEEIGVTSEKVSEIASRLGGGSISQVELLISRVDAMGVSFDEMGGLADAALRISIERGEDSHVIFNKLIRAIATGKQTYLQQLGITLDLKQAWDDYAESIGKTRAELTETEKANVTSKLAIAELNEAFAGQAPDKYASNLGEVRDRFNNLNDVIKRLVGDSLARLGAVLGGGLFNGNFASGPVESRAQQAQKNLNALTSLMADYAQAESGTASFQATLIEKAGRLANIPVQQALDTMRTVRVEYDGTVRDMVERVEYDAEAIQKLYEQVKIRLGREVAGAAREFSRIHQAEVEARDAATEVAETARQKVVEDFDIEDTIVGKVVSAFDTARRVYAEQAAEAQAILDGVEFAKGAGDDILSKLNDLAAIDRDRQRRDRERRIELVEGNPDAEPELAERLRMEAELALIDEQRQRELELAYRQMDAELALIDEQHQREIELAVVHEEELLILDSVFDARRTAAREKYAQMRIKAQVAEAQSIIGNTRAIVGAFGEVADAANASDASKAVIKRLLMLADAADSFAEAAVAGPAAPAFIAKGVGKLAAAALYQDTASAGGAGGGGGGGAVPSLPTSTSAPGPADLPPREGAGPMNVSIAIDGSLFLDEDGMTNAVRKAMSQAGDAIGFSSVQVGRVG